MKYRVIIKNNRYIPQVQDKEGNWGGYKYATTEEMMKNNSHLIGFGTQVEVEAFIYREMNKIDPDHQYVWKTYEA